ncbi:hypothetical protein [Inhella gelatinilytica]|uniref:Uncharacterized protein n=1 Tax=Inhella gelatinilytica TaxID=2795030 RepID=A0A931IX71_9BURK|nr:hypothetical protein [Inhella gelatinilytica]MBH9551521.1 hypothetical protein [Inhella gelatinilytica]
MRWLFGLAALALTALVFWGAAALVGLIFGPKSATSSGSASWTVMVPVVIGLVVLVAVRLRMAREKRRRARQHDDDA